MRTGKSKKFALNTSLNHLSDNGKVTNFSVGKDGNPYITYKAGADTVTKKLGSSIGDEEVLYENGTQYYPFVTYPTNTSYPYGTLTDVQVKAKFNADNIEFNFKDYTSSSSTYCQAFCNHAFEPNIPTLYSAVYVEFHTEFIPNTVKCLIPLAPNKTATNNKYIAFGVVGGVYNGIEEMNNGFVLQRELNQENNAFPNARFIITTPGSRVGGELGSILYITKISLIKR